MTTSFSTEIEELFDRWSAHMGWREGGIDLAVDDASSFATHDSTLTSHAPLWGTKAGDERAIPLAEVRKGLARLTRWVRLTRQDMHLALHPDGHAMGIFIRVKARLPLIPITVRTVPLTLVLTTARTENCLRISHVDEWPAVDPDGARRILVDHHGWPAATSLHPQVAFGAVS